MRTVCGWLLAGVLAGGVLGGCKGKADDVIAVDPYTFPPAPDMEVAWVAVYQNQENVVLNRGYDEQVGSSPPILAGRDMWVRVGVNKVGATFSRDVMAVLQVQQGTNGAVNHYEIGRARTPRAESPETTFNFQIPGEQVTKGLRLEVSVRDLLFDPYPDGTLSPNWKWLSPRFEVENTDRIDLVIVPIVIQDDDDYEPDTSPEQLALIKEMVEAQYPVEGVDIRVDDAMTWLGPFGSGSDWGEILGRVADRRDSADIARANTYYYGAIAPPDPYSGGGIAGLSNVATSPADGWARSSVGWGYSGPESVDVLLHEVGHAHGRFHVACGGAGSPDPGYPHQPDQIGIRAYDPVTETFLNPEDAADVMSYCMPTWVSDYTASALHERTLALRGMRSAAPRELRRGRVDASGKGTPSGWSRTAADPAGEQVLVQPYGLADQPLPPVEGWLYPYDHLPGGAVLFEDPDGHVARFELVEKG